MTAAPMIPEQRRRELLRALRRERVLSYRQVTDLLGVSLMTARRDVAALAEEGRVQATTGGVALPTRLVAEPRRADKELTDQPAKAAIAAAAAAMVTDDVAVYLDAGTTVQAMRPHLEERRGLTVVSNDLSTLLAFADHPGAELVCVGGRMDKDNHSTVGRLAALVLAELSLDIAFLSTSSWDLRHGVTTPVEAKVDPKRAALRSATTTVLLADSAKYGASAQFRVLQLAELDAVVTDDRMTAEQAGRIAAIGVDVHRAAVSA